MELFGAASVPQRNLPGRTGASSDSNNTPQGPQSIFLSVMSPAKQPSWGQEGLFLWGQATVTGHRQALSDSGSCGTRGLCRPRRHLALLRDPENSLFVRLPSGPPEEKHFHWSASACLPLAQAIGEGEGSHEPHEPQQLGVLPQALTRQRGKEVKGQGSPGEGFPFPLT